MPETSIVVKATDRYSDAVKKMATVTKSFSKDVDGLEIALARVGQIDAENRSWQTKQAAWI